MGRPYGIHDLRLMSLVLMALFAAGCVTPCHFGLEHVSTGLGRRTGHLLGPETAPHELAIPLDVGFDDGLSEREATSLGLWNNAPYRELLADLHITRADLIEARQLTNPEISTLFPVGSKSWEFWLMTPLDMLILRPHRTTVAQLESQRVAERLVQDGLNAVRDVRVAYFELARTEQLERLAEDGARLRNQTAQIAEARLQAGVVAELDVAALRLDALFGQEQVIRAARDVELAREQLRFLLGVELTEIKLEPGALAEVPPLDVDVAQLIGEGIASRPDLRAVKLALTAAYERARLARIDYWNIRGILPDINNPGRNGFEAGLGLRFFVPIFHQNQGSIVRAEAEAERVRRRYATLEDSVALEIRQAHTRLLQAQQGLRLWSEQVVPQTEAAMEIARKALEEDGAPLLLVLETTRQMLTAQQSELQATADVRLALADLERSVGRSLFDGPIADEGIRELALPELDVNVEEVLP